MFYWAPPGGFYKGLGSHASDGYLTDTTEWLSSRTYNRKVLGQVLSDKYIPQMACDLLYNIHICVCVCLSHATWQMRLGDKRLGHIYHPTGCRTGTSHHMARDLMYNIYNMYCHLTGATRRLASRAYHPTGCRTGTSHHMARDLLYNIYNMYCKSRATWQVLLGD